jgi:hypothetical protein
MIKVITIRCAGIVFLLLVLLAYLRWPLWPDHTLYLYMGQCWLKGLLPYKDVFDQNWPGIIWISQLITLLGGDNPIGVRIFDACWQWLSCILLFYIASRFVSKGQALASVILYIFMYLAASFGSTAQREGFACLFLGVAFLLLVSDVNNPRAMLRAGAAGLMLSIAIFIKPTLGLILCFLCVYYFLRAVYGEKRCWGMILGLVFGSALPFLAYFLYLEHTGTLTSFWDACIVFAARYAKLDMGWFARRLALFLVAYPPGRLTILAVFLLIMMVFRKKFWSAANSLLVIFLVGALGSLFVQRRLAYYHSMPFCYFGSVFVIAGIANSQWLGRMLCRFRFDSYAQQKVAVVLAFVLILPVGFDLPRSIYSLLSGQSAVAYGDQQRVNRGLPPWSMVKNVGEAVRTGTTADTPVICVADSDCPDYYFICERAPGIRYVQLSHLFFDKNRNDEILTVVSNDLRPKILIVQSGTLCGKPILEYFAGMLDRATRLFNQTYGDGKTVTVYYICNFPE